VNTQDYADYSLNVTQSGVYSISYQISTPMNNAKVSIYVDDTLVSTDNVPNNGSWGNYQTLNTANTATLSSGWHTLRIVASGSNNWQWNMDKIVLNKSGNFTPPQNTELVIEAESFNSTSGTFNDGFVPFGMNKTGASVNYVNKNDSANYYINVTQPATYYIAYKISTPMNNAKVSIYIDDTLVSTDNVPNNGSWGNYQTLNTANTANLSSGWHILRILASGSNNWQWNMDKIILTTNSMFSKTGGNKSSLVVDANEMIEDIKIFPNPADRTLHIQGKGIQSIKIFSTLGVLVLNEETDNTIVNISNLSNGIYILQLANATTKITKRIVVKH